MGSNNKESAFEWQVDIWDKISDIYVDEIEKRFGPVYKHMFDRAELCQGETVLDLGTGTGQIAFGASSLVGETGRVTGVDISPEMLVKAKAGAKARSLINIEFVEGKAEQIPVDDQSQDIVLASLSMMYVIDRAEAAKEIARVLRPSGRFIAAVWAGPEKSDIVKFQQIAGSFASKPPVEGVGPGALADPSPVLEQLKDAGMNPQVELEYTNFEFPDFQSAWDALAGVTTANLDQSVQDEAKLAVRESMWKNEREPKQFRNGTHYITATKPE